MRLPSRASLRDPQVKFERCETRSAMPSRRSTRRHAPASNRAQVLRPDGQPDVPKAAAPQLRQRLLSQRPRRLLVGPARDGESALQSGKAGGGHTALRLRGTNGFARNPGLQPLCKRGIAGQQTCHSCPGRRACAAARCDAAQSHIHPMVLRRTAPARIRAAAPGVQERSRAPVAFAVLNFAVLSQLGTFRLARS
jgi:hypothetical protein